MPARRASAYLATIESYYLAWRFGILFAKAGVGIKPARRLGAHGGLEYCLQKQGSE